LNLYGARVLEALARDGRYDFDNFEDRVGDAVAAANADDSDGDGLSNLEELLLGTLPGDVNSAFTEPLPQVGDVNAFYAVDERDPRFAFRRVHTIFCGEPPEFDAITAFAALDEAEQGLALHDTLDTCLQSTFWKDFALHRLADARIRPLESIGFDGLIPLADYHWTTGSSATSSPTTTTCGTCCWPTTTSTKTATSSRALCPFRRGPPWRPVANRCRPSDGRA